MSRDIPMIPLHIDWGSAKCTYPHGVSGLSAKLRRFVQPSGEPYVIYGDPAHGITQNIITPFRQAHLTDDEQEFNTRMSRVRTCVEWGFGKI